MATEFPIIGYAEVKVRWAVRASLVVQTWWGRKTQYQPPECERLISHDALPFTVLNKARQTVRENGPGLCEGYSRGVITSPERQRGGKGVIGGIPNRDRAERVERVNDCTREASIS